MLKYIELKSGYNDNGPAWIGYVKLSQSGRTVYFNGLALTQAKRGLTGANYLDLLTGEHYWVSGVKRRGSNRHWAGTGKIVIEAAAVEEYLALVGKTELDLSRFVISHSIQDTNPGDFVQQENAPLDT